MPPETYGTLLKQNDPQYGSGTLEHRYTNHRTGTQGWYCTTHQRWHYVFPIAVEWHYADGTSEKFREW
jgi:hypothetical protein